MYIQTIAERFVGLVLSQDWNQVTDLPEGDIQTLFDTVVAAGFNPKAVVLGKLTGNWVDQDGPTGETYSINCLCPFKVVGQDSDNSFATGWLDCVLRRVIFGFSHQHELREELVRVIAREIERSIPLEPIQICPTGDKLVENPPFISPLASLKYLVDHTSDTSLLGENIGIGIAIHMYCCGTLVRHRATETRDAIVCQKCHLRVLFPKEVKTYGDIRLALKS